MIHSFSVNTSGLDIRLSVTCGQVFRWKVLSEGSLFGVDGPNWWHVQPNETSATVEGTGDAVDFRRFFRMDEDWPAAEATVREQCPELAPYMDGLPGLRLLQPSDPVEETFCFLCTSNNHLSRIHAMVDKLASYGPSIAEYEGTVYHQFPAVERIAQIDEADLREKGFGYRGKTIPLAAQQIVERGGSDWLQSLKRRPYSEARQELLHLHGVGPKLADCICLFALGHTEAVPVDTHIWQAACRLWFPEFVGTNLTAKKYALITESLQSRLGPLAGWAHQFLFYENLLNWRAR